jgi:Tol biopolymer transport system component
VNPSLSPDGTRVLYESTGQLAGAGHEVWVRDLARETEAKLTFVTGSTHTPVWSPDGRRFACELRNGNRSQIMIGSADGLGAVDTFVVDGIESGGITQWSTSGSRLVFSPGSFGGVFTVSTDSAKRVSTKIAGLPQRLAQGVLSPDGRWLAYATTEGTTQVQVYVQSMTGIPGRWQVSTRSGAFPVWTKGGKEIVFESSGLLMSVDVESEGAFRAGQPKSLFPLPEPSPGPFTRSWNVSEDGKRFFLLVPPRNASRGGIEVVTDFSRLVIRK